MRNMSIANSVYSPFEPELLINAQTKKFFVNPAEKILSKLSSLHAYWLMTWNLFRNHKSMDL